MQKVSLNGPGILNVEDLTNSDQKITTAETFDKTAGINSQCVELFVTLAYKLRTALLIHHLLPISRGRSPLPSGRHVSH